MPFRVSTDRLKTYSRPSLSPTPDRTPEWGGRGRPDGVGGLPLPRVPRLAGVHGPPQEGALPLGRDGEVQGLAGQEGAPTHPKVALLAPGEAPEPFTGV